MRRAGLLCNTSIFFILLILLSGCYSKSIKEKGAAYIALEARNEAGIEATSDTIKLPLDSITKPSYRSFNYVQLANNQRLLIFADKISRRLNIYNLDTKKLIKQIHTDQIQKGAYRLRKFLTQFVSYDSIYVSSGLDLFRIDSSGKVIEHLRLLGEPDGALTNIGYPNQLISSDGNIYLPAIMLLNERKMSELRKWKMIYKISRNGERTDLQYSLPSYFRNHIYSDRFLRTYYCYNRETKHLIISIPASAEIYETNLSTYHKAYAANSFYFDKIIPPLRQEEIDNDELRSKAFLIRDSYGPIYYDDYAKKYLRVAEKKVSNDNLKVKFLSKDISLIVLDSSFRIIGESKISPSIDPYSIFISDKGMYARVINMPTEDTIYLVKLRYKN